MIFFFEIPEIQDKTQLETLNNLEKKIPMLTIGMTPARVTRVSYQDIKPRIIREIIIVTTERMNIETFVLRPS